MREGIDHATTKCGRNTSDGKYPRKQRYAMAPREKESASGRSIGRKTRAGLATATKRLGKAKPGLGGTISSKTVSVLTLSEQVFSAVTAIEHLSKLRET